MTAANESDRLPSTPASCVDRGGQFQWFSDLKFLPDFLLEATNTFFWTSFLITFKNQIRCPVSLAHSLRRDGRFAHCPG